MARSQHQSATRTSKRTPPLAEADARFHLSRADGVIWWLSRHWLATVLVVFGLYVGLPWLAPMFMKLGWTGAAHLIYTAYATQCHQLPQRSFFRFGAQPMYTLSQIQAVFQMTDEPLVLRQFIGNSSMGWKVAWSDRMVSMYGGMFVFGLMYAAFRGRIKPLSWKRAWMLALPLALDGTTHLVSDFNGIGAGFRDTNAWLAWLTDNVWSLTFYAGDAFGSFNSWMRLITGILFGLGTIWFGFPRLDRLVSPVRDTGAA